MFIDEIYQTLGYANNFKKTEKELLGTHLHHINVVMVSIQAGEISPILLQTV